MNKKTKVLLLIVAVLGIAYYVINRKPFGTFKTELKDFAIRDTGMITKIFLADKRGNQVLLSENAEGKWMVNNRYEADLKKINLLKETMHDMEIRNPLAQSEFNTTVAIMASKAVKAEFYHDEELIKTIYVGSATPDQTGTFMMIEGSSTPFIIHITGFVGYLTPRFLPVALKWRDKLVFNYSMNEISKVSVTYTASPEKSFVISHSDSIPVVISPLNNKVINADLNFLKYYLSGFNKLYYEGFDEDIPQEKSDSIRKAVPWCVIRLDSRMGGQKTLRVHLKAVDRKTMQQYDDEGKPLEFDSEKYFAFIDDEKEMVYIQQYNFGRLFRSLNDFEKRLVHKP